MTCLAGSRPVISRSTQSNLVGSSCLSICMILVYATAASDGQGGGSVAIRWLFAGCSQGVAIPFGLFQHALQRGVGPVGVLLHLGLHFACLVDGFCGPAQEECCLRHAYC